MHHIHLSICLSTDTGCFHIVAVVNNVAEKIRVHLSFQIGVWDKKRFLCSFIDSWTIQLLLEYIHTHTMQYWSTIKKNLAICYHMMDLHGITLSYLSSMKKRKYHVVLSNMWIFKTKQTKTKQTENKLTDTRKNWWLPKQGEK